MCAGRKEGGDRERAGKSAHTVFPDALGVERMKDPSISGKDLSKAMKLPSTVLMLSCVVHSYERVTCNNTETTKKTPRLKKTEKQTRTAPHQLPLKRAHGDTHSQAQQTPKKALNEADTAPSQRHRERRDKHKNTRENRGRYSQTPLHCPGASSEAL